MLGSGGDRNPASTSHKVTATAAPATSLTTSKRSAAPQAVGASVSASGASRAPPLSSIQHASRLTTGTSERIAAKGRENMGPSVAPATNTKATSKLPSSSTLTSRLARSKVLKPLPENSSSSQSSGRIPDDSTKSSLTTSRPSSRSSSSTSSTMSQTAVSRSNVVSTSYPMKTSNVSNIDRSLKAYPAKVTKLSGSSGSGSSSGTSIPRRPWGAGGGTGKTGNIQQPSSSRLHSSVSSGIRSTVASRPLGGTSIQAPSRGLATKRTIKTRLPTSSPSEEELRALEAEREAASEQPLDEETFDNKNLAEILDAASAEELDKRDRAGGFGAKGGIPGTARKSLGIAGPSMRVTMGGVGGRRVTGISSVVAKTWQQSQPASYYADFERPQKRASIYAGAVRVVRKTDLQNDSVSDPASSTAAAPGDIHNPDELWRLLNPSAAAAEKALGGVFGTTYQAEDMFHHNDVKEEPAGFSPASFSSESSSASAPQQPPLSKLKKGMEDYFGRMQQQGGAKAGVSAGNANGAAGPLPPRTPGKLGQRAFVSATAATGGSLVTPRRVPVTFVPPAASIPSAIAGVIGPAKVPSAPLGGMIGSPAVKPNVAGAAIRVMNAAEPGAMPGTPMGRGKASNAMTPRRVVAPAFTVASTSVASAAGVFPPGSARKQQTLARTVGLALADMTADPTNVTPVEFSGLVGVSKRMQQMQISGGQGGVGELISFDDHAEGSGVKHRGVEIGVKAGRELEMVFGNAFSAPVPSNIGTSFTMLDVPSLAPPPAQLDPETTRLVEHRQGVLTGDFLLDAFHLGGEVPPLSTEAMIASAAETEANDIKAVTELENRLKPVMIGGDDFEPVVATDEEGEMDPDGIMTKIDELTDLEEKLEREILMMEEAFWKK